jgi:superfamily I DNA and/or RNA helicase
MSWRMHPNLCGFISDAIYDGRLVAHPNNARRQLVLAAGADPALAPSGLVFVPVEHEGNRQDSVEEAARIAKIVRSLLNQEWTDETGKARRLTLNDILIVAPYNLQVQLLIQHLPNGARVGTVDKFQGQEAPVAIVSMATSSPEEAPRGTDFLFSRQRLNVALSRAKSLSILVASPALLDYPAKTVEDLRLLDLFVWAAGDGS